MRTLFRTLLVLAVAGATSAAGLGVFTAATPAAPAAAACSTGIEGTWRSIDAATRSITRVDIRMVGCDDVRRCDADTGECVGGTGSIYDINVFGRCHPTDCEWGSRRMSNGVDDPDRSHDNEVPGPR